MNYIKLMIFVFGFGEDELVINYGTSIINFKIKNERKLILEWKSLKKGENKFKFIAYNFLSYNFTYLTYDKMKNNGTPTLVIVAYCICFSELVIVGSIIFLIISKKKDDKKQKKRQTIMENSKEKELKIEIEEEKKILIRKKIN